MLHEQEITGTLCILQQRKDTRMDDIKQIVSLDRHWRRNYIYSHSVRRVNSPTARRDGLASHVIDITTCRARSENNGTNTCPIMNHCHHTVL